MDYEYQCYLCHETFSNINKYKEHFNVVHSNNTRFACASNRNCNRVFSVFYKHIKHIQRDHNMKNNPQLFVTETGMNDSTSNGTVANIFPTETVTKNTKELMISTTLLRTIIKILSNDRIPRTPILKIVKDLLAYYDTQIKQALNQLKKVNSHEAKIIEETVTVLESMLTPDYIPSEYLLLKKLRSLNVTVEAQTVELSIEQNQVYSISNVIQTISYPYFIKIVPLKELFSILFSKTQILEHILDYMESISGNETTIYNITQTLLWKNKVE